MTQPRRDDDRRLRWSRVAMAGAGAALAALLVLARSGCAPSNRSESRARSPQAPPANQAAPSSPSDHPSAVEPRAPAAKPEPKVAAPHDPPRTADAGAATLAARDDTPADNAARIAAVTAATRADPRSLALLSQIERELEREPPAVVHSLIADHQRGATRAELLERVQRDFPRDVILRSLVVRWIDEVRPEPAPAPPASAPKSPDDRPWISPLQQKR